jgi:hypothetical protein
MSRGMAGIVLSYYPLSKRPNREEMIEEEGEEEEEEEDEVIQGGCSSLHLVFDVLHKLDACVIWVKKSNLL